MLDALIRRQIEAKGAARERRIITSLDPGSAVRLALQPSIQMDVVGASSPHAQALGDSGRKRRFAASGQTANQDHITGLDVFDLTRTPFEKRRMLLDNEFNC